MWVDASNYENCCVAGSRPWVCSVCGRSYVTKYKLRAHMKAHTGELVCSFCGRQFTSQVGWRPSHTHSSLYYTVTTFGIVYIL